MISFVLQGEDPITPEGKKLEALNEFSLSRIRIGNSIERLYASLKDEKVKTRWGNLTITGDEDGLVVEFPSQKCPSGTRTHEDGYLCGKIENSKNRKSKNYQNDSCNFLIFLKIWLIIIFLLLLKTVFKWDIKLLYFIGLCFIYCFGFEIMIFNFFVANSLSIKNCRFLH